MKREGYPERGDLVIIKIKRIMDYGAAADLIEYKDKDGFIHISNVTKSWVKNIRSHVSKGETRVAEVTKVEPKKNTINLSLKDVSDNQVRRKMNDWKREKRTDKVIEKIADKLNEDPDESKKEIIPKLIKTYGDAFTVFEEAVTQGKEALKDLDIPKKWKEEVLKYAEENITPPKVTIEEEITLETHEGEGIKLIKEALHPPDEEAITVKYVSAPKYEVKVTAPDYKEAEEKLKEYKQEIKDKVGERGEISFKRKK